MAKSVYTASGKVNVDTRKSMEPSNLSPDDVREIIRELVTGMAQRAGTMPSESFEALDDSIQTYDKVRAYYGDAYKLINGIEAATNNWDESGQDVKELEEQYSGKFVDGVKIGKRLAVYKDRDFEFTEGSEDSESKFTFTK